MNINVTSTHRLNDRYFEMNDDIVLRMKRNDPRVKSVKWSSHGVHKRGYWKKTGEIIGENTHIEKLKVSCLNRTSCQGIALNRSLREVHIEHHVFARLIPMFQHNRNLRHFSFKNCDLGNWDNFRSLERALMRCEKTSLRCIDLSCNNFNDKQTAELIKAVSGHTNLDVLHLNNNEIGGSAFKELERLLKDPCNITELYLHRSSTAIHVDSVPILVGALTNNTSLRIVSFGGCHNVQSIHPRVWKAFATYLSNASIPLKTIHLYLNEVLDEDATLLATAMSNNAKLKAVDLSCCIYMGPTGWQKLIAGLSTAPAVEAIDITGHCRFVCGSSALDLNDERLSTLSVALAGKTCIKTIKIAHDTYSRITSSAWPSFFVGIASAVSKLEILDISNNSIDDEGLSTLINVLARAVHLSNQLITPRGWRVVQNILVTNPKLENLNLSRNFIRDDTIVPLAQTLATNSNLKILNLQGIGDDGAVPIANALAIGTSRLEELYINQWFCNSHLRRGQQFITTRTWDAFSALLSRTGSVTDTWNSNHRLRLIQHEELPESLAALLETNSLFASYPFDAARKKILLNHFSTGHSNLNIFTGMDLNAHPHSLAWAGRDHDGFSLMYQLVRSIVPSCIDTPATGRKRKIGE